MERKDIIHALAILGDSMKKWGENSELKEFNPFVGNDYYEKMNELILKSKAFNGWFTEVVVRSSLYAFGQQLNEKGLTDWTNQYPIAKTPKKVGLILAGNIPLVGFHDILSTLLSGHVAHVKLSSDDRHLIPILVEILGTLQPSIQSSIQFVDRLNDVDVLIATGSDNTSRYFKKYFGHIPNIIRKNRTSVAVLTGNESKEEVKALGKDLFQYFGLGCRNVSHLLLPKGYDLDQIFGAIVDYGEIINHHKYANNYDYYKAIYLMNEEKLIENGFVLTRESKDLFAPIAVLHYHFYDSQEEANSYLKENKDKIQVVIGKEYTSFGNAQHPALDDYADGVDTMKFLTEH